MENGNFHLIFCLNETTFFPSVSKLSIKSMYFYYFFKCKKMVFEMVVAVQDPGDDLMKKKHNR